jgi:hypothetical protein
MMNVLKASGPPSITGWIVPSSITVEVVQT